MKTACIILNYNDADTTIAQIRRIRDYKSLDAVVVVDNASTDDSVARLTEYVGGKVTLLESETNGGYGAGNNLGVRLASEMLRAKYCLIANPDAEFSDKCAAALVRSMEEHPELGVIAPVMVNPNLPVKAGIPGTRENVLTGAAAWPLRPWLYDLLESGPVSRRVFTGILHYPRWRYIGRKLVPVDCVPGSLLLVDTGKFLQSGGYDENVFLYGEEYMLGHAMRLLGYRTALLTDSFFMHRHAGTIGKSYRKLLERQKLREKSTLYYYKEYLGINSLQELVTKLFYAAVNLEVRLFAEK
ncbi:MAG: glycosyltransferase family 2 protein [Stomatobaculum sp.]|nr:glycosyltransferase family 2 protein [Stomatobaculum sp.]